jgi:signal transduction histidine kinase
MLWRVGGFCRKSPRYASSAEHLAHRQTVPALTNPQDTIQMSNRELLPPCSPVSVYGLSSYDPYPLTVKRTGWNRMDAKTHREAGATVAHASRAELEERVTELLEERAAISEVLHAIAGSPHELQPIFDAILVNATRLCLADSGSFRLCEDKGLRLVALKGAPELFQPWSPPTLLEYTSGYGLLAANKSPIHIPDLADHEFYRQGDPYIVAAVNAAGVRTFLLAPLLIDEVVIGTITLVRNRVEAFTDRQTNLFVDFAAQATIALESIRRERQYRHLQTELGHANRVATIGQITASIAHELKQPFASIVINGNASLRWLKRQPPDIGEVEQSIERLINEAHRASNIIDGLRDLARKTEPRSDAFDLNDAIQEVVSLTHGEAVKIGVTVRTQLARMPRIQGDRVQFQQVMLNLIVNAIEAMSSVTVGARDLEISTETVEEEGARVSVRDTGPGLNAASLERLFDPFYTTKAEGMGMGLAICRWIIEASGGRLRACGCEPRGALFQFTLPQLDRANSNRDYSSPP